MLQKLILRQSTQSQLWRKLIFSEPDFEINYYRMAKEHRDPQLFTRALQDLQREDSQFKTASTQTLFKFLENFKILKLERTRLQNAYGAIWNQVGQRIEEIQFNEPLLLKDFFSLCLTNNDFRVAQKNTIKRCLQQSALNKEKFRLRQLSLPVIFASYENQEDYYNALYKHMKKVFANYNNYNFWDENNFWQVSYALFIKWDATGNIKRVSLSDYDQEACKKFFEQIFRRLDCLFTNKYERWNMYTLSRLYRAFSNIDQAEEQKMKLQKVIIDYLQDQLVLGESTEVVSELMERPLAVLSLIEQLPENEQDWFLDYFSRYAFRIIIQEKIKMESDHLISFISKYLQVAAKNKQMNIYLLDNSVACMLKILSNASQQVSLESLSEFLYSLAILNYQERFNPKIPSNDVVFNNWQTCLQLIETQIKQALIANKQTESELYSTFLEAKNKTQSKQITNILLALAIFDRYSKELINLLMNPSWLQNKQLDKNDLKSLAMVQLWLEQEYYGEIQFHPDVQKNIVESHKPQIYSSPFKQAIANHLQELKIQYKQDVLSYPFIIDFADVRKSQVALKIEHTQEFVEPLLKILNGEVKLEEKLIGGQGWEVKRISFEQFANMSKNADPFN